jgi:uncharacterized protein (TIGR02186 family)
MRRGLGPLVLAIAALLPFTVARGEELIAELSDNLIQISSNFTGTEIILFGAIAGTDAFETAKGRDIVVVVRGPDTDVTVRRKEPVGGLWVNRTAAAFTGVPGFYFVASTRPLSEIAAPGVLARSEIGLQQILLQRTDMPGASAPSFEEALRRQRVREGLFAEQSDPDIIRITGEALFQVRVPLPARVPVGNYRAEAFLFRDGQIVSAYSAPLFVDKSGIEEFLYEAAYEWPLVYGLLAVLGAMGAGWLSSALFRKT